MRRSLITFLAVLVTAPVWAGRLTGSVRTPDGAALPQLVLNVEGRAGRRTLVTGPDGGFSADLAPGEYRIGVDAPGFALRPEPTVAVADGEVHLDLTLAHEPLREQVQVSATRGEAPAASVGVSVSVLDRDQIDERQARTSLDLLQQLPGVDVARAGGVGSQASAFVRGGESSFARVLVDGIPVNQPGGLFDFGSALPLQLEQVENVRGAASSLYGTDALAGVIQLVTRRAQPGERPELRLEAEGGSFDWQRYQGGSSGRAGGFDWSFGVLHQATDNEVPNNAFRENAGALSAGRSLGERDEVRLVVRGEDSQLGTPGPTAYGPPDLDASFERQDWMLGARYRHAGDDVVHTAQVGWAKSDQLSLDPKDSGCFVPSDGVRSADLPFCDFADPLGYQNDTERLSADYQLEARLGARNLLTGGAAVEHETGDIGSRSDPSQLIAPERTNVGAFIQDRLVLGDRVYLNLGGRVEHNGSFGTRAVPRAALAFRARGGPNATTLRASAGAGIQEPTFLQSYGVSFYAQGNPDLKPQRSRTFDLGVEQRFASGRGLAEATYFHHDYLDQIAYQVVDFTTFQGSYVNLGKTRAQGVELGLSLAPWAGVALGANYTYLDGEVLVSSDAFNNPIYDVGQPLLRRPRHRASAVLSAQRGRVLVGATLVYVGSRADSDFLGIGLTENSAYTRLDARLRVRLGAGFEAFLVGENLLDRRYQEVLGYPALSRSIRGGVRFASGRRS